MAKAKAAAAKGVGKKQEAEALKKQKAAQKKKQVRGGSCAPAPPSPATLQPVGVHAVSPPTSSVPHADGTDVHMGAGV